MPKKIEQIKAPISEEMKLFEKKFYVLMKSKVALLDRITYYIVRRKGKQMRPMFVFLTANLLGETNEKTYRAASFIELIHTASLVHDDVVDESFKRRGFFSLNALWKNKIAVLVGDYMFSKTLIIATENEDFDLLKVVSIAIKEISEGELLQIEKARKLDITEQVYFNIIRQKTATLIAACCESGARSVNASEEDAKKLHKFGELAGIAFQIKDDLFDYSSSNLIGKPVGIDIKEQKMTLPLLHVLNQVDNDKRKWMIRIVKHHNKNPKIVAELIQFIKDNNGIEYTEHKMYEFVNQAKEILNSFPKNEYRDALFLMLDYVMKRKH